MSVLTSLLSNTCITHLTSVFLEVMWCKYPGDLEAIMNCKHNVNDELCRAHSGFIHYIPWLSTLSTGVGHTHSLDKIAWFSIQWILDLWVGLQNVNVCSQGMCTMNTLSFNCVWFTQLQLEKQHFKTLSHAAQEMSGGQGMHALGFIQLSCL